MKNGWMICLVLSSFIGIVMAEEPAMVGQLGGREALVFQGNETFTGEQICKELFGETDIIVAMSPEASFSTYLRTIKSKIIGGYRNAGFYEPRVSLLFDEGQQKIVVTIKEGPRYREGRIVITGTGEALANDLTERLRGQDPIKEISGLDNIKENQAAREKAIASLQKNSLQFPFMWKEDEWVCFDESFIKPSHRYVESLLNLLGYYQGQFELKVVPVEDNHTADLHLDFTSEGTKARVSSIDINGNSINSDDRVMAWLGIKSGMAINSMLTTELEQKLQESGRFRQVAVTQSINEKDPNNGVLTITLQESAGVTQGHRMKFYLTLFSAQKRTFNIFVPDNNLSEKFINLRF